MKRRSSWSSLRMYMTDLLKNDDGITYEEAFADDEYRPVVEEWSLSKLG